jgi:hypothetical protein
MTADHLCAQVGAPPRVGNEPSEGNEGLRGNVLDAGPAVAMVNPIVRPRPLSAAEKDGAIVGIDRHLAEEIAQLRAKLDHILPDEIGMLAKTGGWTPAQQQALVAALRVNDPTAVFEAWSQAAPQDTAGAELASRQTDARRLAAKVEQDLEKNRAAMPQDLAALDDALGKIAVATPAVAELSSAVHSLQTWLDARRIVAAAAPAKGPDATLPKGQVALIYDPSLKVGEAIVLSDGALLIGNEGHAGLMIKTGNAAQALGLPIVTGSPLDEAEWPEMTDGIMLCNRLSTKSTINYNLNGNHYVMEPGMAQRLENDRKWIVDFDRGQGLGPADYTLEAGTYHFTPTDLGWQLYKQRFDVVLDNSQNPQQFNFIFHGEVMTVPAGGTKTLTSTYPIVVKFDRGNGSDFSVKMMHFSGNVQVGVNAEDNLWDLFPTAENQREVTRLKLFQ